MKAGLAGYAEKTHRSKIPLRRHWVDTEEHSFFFKNISLMILDASMMKHIFWVRD